MKTIFFAFILCSKISYSQENAQCQIVDAILVYQPAKSAYIFDRNKAFPINLIDTSNFFKDCKFPNYYDREVRISNDISQVQVRHPSNYLIDVTKINESTYRVLLFYRTKGTHSWFTVNKKGNKFKVTKFEEGYL